MHLVEMRRTGSFYFLWEATQSHVHSYCAQGGHGWERKTHKPGHLGNKEKKRLEEAAAAASIIFLITIPGLTCQEDCLLRSTEDRPLIPPIFLRAFFLAHGKSSEMQP